MINISVVLYKNQEKQIQDLLHDMLFSDGEIVNKIYLIDNSPGDDLQKLRLLNNKIVYMHSSSNLGYGTAHNIAIAESVKNKIFAHLVVNPDIRFDQNTLLELCNYLKKNKDVGLVMPKICYPNGNIQQLCKLVPTPLYLFGRRFLPKAINKPLERKYGLLDFEFNKETNVPILSGCFMFMRTDILSKLGGFDERYFMYLEDFDLSRRIHSKYKTIFYPYVKVYHEYNRESKRNFKLLWIHIKSSIKYFNKFGWFWDKERRIFNKRFLISYSNYRVNK